MKKVGYAVLIALSISVANAADWFDGVSANMQRVEQDSSGNIWPMLNTWANGGLAVTVSGHSSSCNVTNIQLVPPAGREKDWLAMVLAATLAGKTVSVFGDCVPASYRIVSSRLIVDY